MADNSSDFDEIMDALTQGQRNKVLERLGMNGHKVEYKPRHNALWLMLSACWGLPVTLIGILLCMSIIGFVPGIGILFIGGAPFAWNVAKAVENVTARKSQS